MFSGQNPFERIHEEELVNAEVSRIFQLQATNPPEVADKAWIELLNREHSPRISYGLPFHYNEFRIKYAAQLPKTRPQILIGGPFEMIYPNVHSFPLFQVADVVVLACTSEILPYASALNCRIGDHFDAILQRLPKGFEPDFYFDNQIEHQHYVPYGIEIAPFPIIASLCHTFLHKSIEHVCELFDLVAPISGFHARLLRKKYPEKVIDMPFGLNWGAFQTIYPCWEKKQDVCVTFSDDASPAYAGRRKVVLELVEKFKRKYGNRFSIEIAPPLDKEKYIEKLSKSRITLNVTGVNGPYNYRTMEAMAAGSMIFQYDWDNDFFENKFSELFNEGFHGVSFNEENFEEKLLHYLENPEITAKIAKNAYEFVNDRYSYSQLYQELIAKVKASPILLPRHQSPHQGWRHVSMIYYNQNNEVAKLLDYTPEGDYLEDPWIEYNNLMVLAGDLEEKSAGRRYLTALANEALTDKLTAFFYERARDLCPPEFFWIIQWNYLLLRIQSGKNVANEIDEIIAQLEELDPEPFDEGRLFFKYFVNSPRFPRYQLGPKSTASIHKFTELNINLMKVIDCPKERARLHKHYALAMAKDLKRLL